MKSSKQRQCRTIPFKGSVTEEKLFEAQRVELGEVDAWTVAPG